ncbi:MAG: Gfo/Idh/MocA family oxidoreductase [Bacteroidales bacterium]|jgi:predicted dehydrogenase|nr:Gfo/Idh/MocA family oxidoreductase [Bacteroidales bacterium]
MERRNFIKEIGMMGGSGLLVSAFPWLHSCTLEAEKEIKGEKARLGVIGTGSRGMYHLNHLLTLPHVEVVALCDNYEPHLKQAAALFPNAKTFSRHTDLLSMPGIDGVFVVTPLSEHAHITIDALKAGKHTFCEKSMATTTEDCLAMYNTYKETGKVLYIGQQRLFDPKYLKAIEMIHSGIIGDITGIRCYWFRNNDWRRPVEHPSLERKINWRLYKEFSGGLMTELATHQLQVGNWVLKMIPETVAGFGDIIFWKDSREVYDNVCLVYRYANGINMTYESVISNKFNGLEEQILGHKGTMELEKGKYYFEEVKPAAGILQLINQIEHRMFDNVSFAGPSWVPETAQKYQGEYVLNKISQTEGSSTVGVVDDGSLELADAFCHSVITGRPAENLVEEAYYSSVLALLGLQAMEEQRIIKFPDEYKIPYLNFA